MATTFWNLRYGWSHPLADALWRILEYNNHIGIQFSNDGGETWDNYHHHELVEEEKYLPEIYYTGFWPFRTAHIHSKTTTHTVERVVKIRDVAHAEEIIAEIRPKIHKVK